MVAKCFCNCWMVLSTLSSGAVSSCWMASANSARYCGRVRVVLGAWARKGIATSHKRKASKAQKRACLRRRSIGGKFRLQRRDAQFHIIGLGAHTQVIIKEDNAGSIEGLVKQVECVTDD